MDYFNKPYSHQENITMTLERAIYEALDGDNNFTIDDLRPLAARFVQWEETHMPHTADGWPDWSAVSEATSPEQCPVEVFYHDAWHPACDWAEALNIFIHTSRLPRIRQTAINPGQSTL